MDSTRTFPARVRTRRTSAISAALLVIVAAFGLQACDDDDGLTDANRPSRVNDARGDFLATFAGPNNADLDVTRAEVTFDGTNFIFESTSAGPIGTTPNALFVWGVDRGQGTARFGDLATGVHFDLVVVVQPGGITSVRDLTPGGTAQNLPAGNVSVAGNELRVTVPATLLPGRGFSQERFTVNLWPRTGAGNNNQIADFAPDNQNVPVRVMR
ncbi:MAG TPA: hypothetical protein VE913_19220 [Longimicrobium sp.]|nr:hypothetical protein [Longimicrobium sp.]